MQAGSRSSGSRSSCGLRRGRCSSRAETTCASTGRRTSTGARSRSESRSTCRATSRARRWRSRPACGPSGEGGCATSSTRCTRRSSARARTSRRTRRSRGRGSPCRSRSRQRRSPPPTRRSSWPASARSGSKPRRRVSAASRRCSATTAERIGAWAGSSDSSQVCLSSRAAPERAQLEIIFFSMPTPAATARSYSSGTVAESWSAMPVESNTVTWSSDCAPVELPRDHLADLARDVVLGDQHLRRGRR